MIDDVCHCEKCSDNTTPEHAENMAVLREDAYKYGTFERALVALKHGCKVSRFAWGGDYLVIANGLIMRYDSHFNVIGDFLKHARAADLLANDWRVVM